jgi:hypothetical protein
MAFIPKIMHDECSPSAPAFSDDPAEEMELPEDLGRLAGQLVRESALLAKRFPAGDGSGRPGYREVQLSENGAMARSALTAGDRRGDAARFLGPALILLFAISGGAWLLWAGWAAFSPPSAGQLGDYSSEASTRRVSYRPAENAATSDSRVRPVPLGKAPFSEGHNSFRPSGASLPASVVHELSGPELEGFLDLLDEGDGVGARLSI